MSAQANGIGTPYRPPVTQRPPKKESTFGKRGKGLRRPKKSRPMKPQAMNDLIADVMLRDGRCVAANATESWCDGATQAHHLIPQRELRRHYELGDPIFKNLENVVALCERHHSNVERKLMYLPDEVLPEGFAAFLTHFGFDTWWDAEIARRV
jgi:hypothetical protein